MRLIYISITLTVITALVSTTWLIDQIVNDFFDPNPYSEHEQHSAVHKLVKEYIYASKPQNIDDTLFNLSETLPYHFYIAPESSFTFSQDIIKKKITRKESQ